MEGVERSVQRETYGSLYQARENEESGLFGAFSMDRPSRGKPLEGKARSL